MTRHLSLVLTLLASAAFSAGLPQDLIEQILPPDVVLANASALGLSSEQEQQLRQVTAPMQREMGAAQARMRARNAELVNLLAAPKPDDAPVMAKFAELEAAESKVKTLRLKMTLAVKAVLSAEQQQQAAKLSVAENSGPRLGDGSMIRDKLQRVRDGIARMQREGRDLTEVKAAWAEFQNRAELRHHQLAMKALNEALRIVEQAQTSTPQPE